MRKVQTKVIAFCRFLNDLCALSVHSAKIDDQRHNCEGEIDHEEQEEKDHANCEDWCHRLACKYSSFWSEMHDDEQKRRSMQQKSRSMHACGQHGYRASVLTLSLILGLHSEPCVSPLPAASLISLIRTWI
jgi:hypothetical protein